MKLSLDWSRYKDAGMGDAYADIPKQGGDYAKAIAVCINSSQCETLNKQVMCPSYKVSEDSQLSTGGRVRLLKSALSSSDWEQALVDPVLSRAIDLCVSCKGCKRECDNNVDMALIKAEYLAWRAQREGLSIRSGLFAHTPLWLHYAPWLRFLIRWRNNSSILRSLGQKWLGISAKMPLPIPANNKVVTLPNAVATPAENVGDNSEPLPEVVLFVDTFTAQFEPEIAQAAQKVLHAGGYQVLLATADKANKTQRPLCCGRTYLAQGMVEQAKAEVRRLVAALQPHVQAERMIVGLEASCVLGLRDDALALDLGDLNDTLNALSKRVLLLEEFLAKEQMAKRLNLPLQSLTEETLVHGHCHQKAVGAMKAVRRVLKLVPQLQFNMIESGCCGMAGTFSLEAEHQAMGSDMANQGLMPTLKANPTAKVVANGFSCRQQMRAHGDNRPQHLATLLSEALLSEHGSDKD